MKKSLFAAAILTILSLFLVIPSASAAEPGSAPMLEIAVGIGAMELDKNHTGIDDNTGFGLNMGIRFSAATLPIGAEWRIYGGSFSIDDSDCALPAGNYGPYEFHCDDCDYTITGTDFSLLFNFNHGGILSPYVGAGFLFESTTLSADVHMKESGSWRHYRRHEEWDEDGITFLARAGLDLRTGLLYARFDAGFIGEIYDSDDSNQFIVSGDVGIGLVPSVRLDCFGHYFTEYKSFYIGIGATVSL